jgi:hypothetical protein
VQARLQPECRIGAGGMLRMPLICGDANVRVAHGPVYTVRR